MQVSYETILWRAAGVFKRALLEHLQRRQAMRQVRWPPAEARGPRASPRESGERPRKTLGFPNPG
jgi:hypothetical protein